jgi:hypothetical protein
MNKKLTEQEQKLLYLNNKKFYDRLMAESMAMAPRLRDNYELLNKVFPKFYTTDLLKKLDMFCNSLYYSQSGENLADVADEEIYNVKKLVEFFDKSFEL